MALAGLFLVLAFFTSLVVGAQPLSTVSIVVICVLAYAALAPVLFSTRKQVKKRNSFVASTLQKRYHKNTCRLGKLIKTEFLLQAKTPAAFKKRRYKACKKCMR